MNIFLTKAQCEEMGESSFVNYYLVRAYYTEFGSLAGFKDFILYKDEVYQCTRNNAADVYDLIINWEFHNPKVN
jgi:hypothetical protein